MLRHIVLFTIKPEYHDRIPSMIEAFHGLRGNVDGLIALEAGADILQSERSCDLALVCLFRDRAAFDAYQTHPLHVPIRKRMHEARLSSASADFLVDG